MIRLTLGAVVAVTVLAVAIAAAGTVWSIPLAFAACGIGALLVGLEGDLR